MRRAAGNVPAARRNSWVSGGRTVELNGNDSIDIFGARAATGTDTTSYGFLDGLKLDLAQDDLVWDRNLDLASCTPAVANFNGYAQKTVTWQDASIADDGSVEVLSDPIQWVPTGSSTPNSIYGIYATLAGGNTLGFNGRFDDAPLPMDSVFQQITVTLRYRPTNGGLVDVIT